MLVVMVWGGHGWETRKSQRDGRTKESASEVRKRVGKLKNVVENKGEKKAEKNWRDRRGEEMEKKHCGEGEM